MSNVCIGNVAASGRSISNAEEKNTVGYADDGVCVNMRVQCAFLKALCPARKVNLGGYVVVLDAGRSYTQNEENGQRTRIDYEEW